MLTSSVYFYVLLFLAVEHCQTLLSDPCCCNQITPDSEQQFANGVNFTYYYCNGTNRTFPINDSLGLLSVLNREKRTIIYIHGFLDSSNAVISALCCRRHNEYNIVDLEWSKYSGNPNIFETFPNANKLGIILAKCIKNLKNNRFNESTLDILCGSLGCIVAGMTGKCTQELYSIIMPRITAFEPANPELLITMQLCPMKSTYATCVVVIHTDIGGLGAGKCGKADFYANCGKSPQPGCEFPILPRIDMSYYCLFYKLLFSLPVLTVLQHFCSHGYAFKIFNAMECNRTEFVATQCPCCESYNAGYCSENCNITLKYETLCNKEGDFYFNAPEL